MKLLTVYLTIFLFAIFGILPAVLHARGKEFDGKPVRLKYTSEIPAILLDTVAPRRTGEKRDQDRPAADARPGENRPGDNRPGENRPEDIRRIE